MTDLSNGCNDPVSNTVSVDVNEQPTVAISVDNDLICIGGVSMITSTISNGSGVYDYQWQSSADGVNGWSNINPNGTSASYNTTGVIPGITYYRILVFDLSNGCEDPESNVVSITVSDQPIVEIAVNNAIVLLFSQNLTNSSSSFLRSSADSNAFKNFVRDTVASI